MGFLKRLWNAIRVILLVIVLVVVLLVAWEAILVAFEYGAVEYAWMGSLGSAFVSAGQWAAASPWLFATASLLAIGVVSPSAAVSVVKYVGDVVTTVVDAVVDTVGTGIKTLVPAWVWYAALGYLAYTYTKGGRRDKSSPGL